MKPRVLAPGQIFDHLLALPRFRPAPRRDVAAHLFPSATHGDWWRRLDAIKVTGSSGKGSVATMIAAILHAAGLRVGLTVSPHIHDVAERVRVGGEPASARSLTEAFEALGPRLETAPAPALAFEAVTALALEVFARSRVDVVVAEAGIGGRHDMVAGLPSSLSVLVSVDFEHTAILGSSLEEIARDKADLAGAGSQLLTGPMKPEILAAVREQCRERGVEVLELEEATRVELCDARDSGEPHVPGGPGGPGEPGERCHISLPGFSLDLLDLDLPVCGAQHAENAALAILASLDWLRRHAPDLDRAVLRDAIRRGLGTVSLPGRFERLALPTPRYQQTNPRQRRQSESLVWLDIAHTPEAVRHLVATARRHLELPVVLLLGVSADKDPKILAPPLIDLAAKVIVTRAAERGGDPRAVAALVEAAGKPVRILEPLPAAAREALDEARRNGMPLLIAGGLFLAREAAAALRASQRASRSVSKA